MKTIEEIKTLLFKQKKEEVQDALFLRDNDVIQLMSDGVFFLRVTVEPGGAVIVTRHAKADVVVKEKP
jgi:hypothetical protein